MKKILPILVFAVLMVGVAQVEALTWDTSNAADTNITEGAGTWDIGVTNWNDAAESVPWSNGNAANFGGGTAGTAGTVTLAGDITAAQVRFNVPAAGNYTLDLAGNTLNVTDIHAVLDVSSATITNGTLATTGNQAWSLTSTGWLNIYALITGTGSLSKNGAGNLLLANDGNSFTGNFTAFNSRNVKVTSIGPAGVNSAVGAGSQIYLHDNAVFQYIGGGDTTDRDLRFAPRNATIDHDGSGPLIFTGLVIIGNTGTTYNHNINIRGSNADANEIRGGIPETATVGARKTYVIKSDIGSWTLSGTNSYTGDTTVNGGTLMIGGTHAGGAKYTVNSGCTLGCAGAIAITNGLTLNAGCTNIITASNLQTGAYGSFTVTGGTINLGSADLVIEDTGVVGGGEVLLIDNQTGSPIVGTYNTGAEILGATRKWNIRYDAGDGDDVALTLIPLSTAIMIQ